MISITSSSQPCGNWASMNVLHSDTMLSGSHDARTTQSLMALAAPVYPTWTLAPLNAFAYPARTCDSISLLATMMCFTFVGDGAEFFSIAFVSVAVLLIIISNLVVIDFLIILTKKFTPPNKAQGRRDD